MKLQIDSIECDIAKSTGGKRDLADMGPKGWYWQEPHLPPDGPFKTPLGALLNFVAQFESGQLAERLVAADEMFERKRAERLAREAISSTRSCGYSKVVRTAPGQTLTALDRPKFTPADAA